MTEGTLSSATVDPPKMHPHTAPATADRSQAPISPTNSTTGELITIHTQLASLATPRSTPAT